LKYGFRRVVEELVPQVLAGFEIGHPLGRDLEGFARYGIASLANWAVPQLEAPEASQFHPFVTVERIHDALEKHFDHQVGRLLVEIELLPQNQGEVGLGEGL